MNKFNTSNKKLIYGLPLLLAPVSINGGEIKTLSKLVWQTGQTNSLEIQANNSGVSHGPRKSEVSFLLEEHPLLNKYYTNFHLPKFQYFFGIVETSDYIQSPGFFPFGAVNEAFAVPPVSEGSGSLVFYNFALPENNLILGTYHTNLSQEQTFLRYEGEGTQSPVSIFSSPITITPDLKNFSNSTKGRDIISNAPYIFNTDGNVNLSDLANPQIKSLENR